MLDALKQALNGLTLQNILQVSMDCPNVNFKFLRLLKEDIICQPEDKTILDTGSCGLHTIHCAFKNGFKATDWQIIQFLRAIYNIFKDVPSRRGDFKQITGSSLFPLKFCAIRWLENESVVERAMTLLPKIEMYVEAVKQSPKEPKCQSFRTIEECLKSKLLKAQLVFFQGVSAQISPFLREFQSDEPLAPFLYSALTNLVHSLLSQIVKSDVMDKTPLAKIDLKKKENLLDAKSINLGFGTKSAIRQCANVSTTEMRLFRDNCRQCLITIIEHVLVKSPLKFKLTKGLSFLDPKVVLSKNGSKPE